MHRGTWHDRDINASKTFLRSGLTVLWKESPCFSKGSKSNGGDNRQIKYEMARMNFTLTGSMRAPGEAVS